MEDFLRRTEDGTFEEVGAPQLREELAGDSFRYITQFIRGADVVGYDDGTEYTLSFNDDGEGYFWLKVQGDGVRQSTSFVQVEASGAGAYFLLGADNDVEMTLDVEGEQFDAIRKVLRVLAYGYTGGPLE